MRQVIAVVLILGVVGIAVVMIQRNGAGAGKSISQGSAPPDRSRGTEQASGNADRATDRIKPTRQQLTEKDRAALWQRLIELPDEEAVALLLSLADRDVTAAFELALAYGGLDGKGEAAREALRGLIGRDLDAAIAWGQARWQSPEMDLFWVAAIELTAGSNPALALGLSGNTSGALRLTLLEDIFAEWADEDTEAAKGAAMSLVSKEERSAAHLAILASEMKRDLDGALAWIDSIKDSELQDALYYHAVRDWAGSDPKGAAHFTASLVESDYKTHLAGMILESWIKDDPGAALAWASILPDQESREEAISRGIRKTMESSPEKAADLALRLPAESDRAAALEYVISAWVESDSTALAEWIAHVPDTAARTRMAQMMQDHLSSAGGE